MRRRFPTTSLNTCELRSVSGNLHRVPPTTAWLSGAQSCCCSDSPPRTPSPVHCVLSPPASPHLSGPSPSLPSLSSPSSICLQLFSYCTFLLAQMVKSLPAMQETWVQSLGQGDPLEKETATHSSILACRIPWTEEPGGLQSVGSQQIGHN